MDASIELIGEVKAHWNADKLDLVKVLGFQCVTQKGLYKGGEKIVYVRPDSLLPVESWTEEYRKYSPKRIKACLLRKEWSEGIVIPFDILPNGNDLKDLEVGTDVAAMIGVTHYEPPAPNDLKVKGGLPYQQPKTDEERYENFPDHKLPYGQLVDIGLKVDGQSCLSEETLVETKDGIKTIKEICDSKYKGKVKCFNTESNEEEWQKIENHLIQENDNDWFELETETGEILTLTSNHRVYLPELKCYRQLKDLKGDENVVVL